jgi:CubicO group peptidase (beta-lactamase class C family)
MRPLFACATALTLALTAPLAAAPLTADTAQTAAAGATFTAPSGWSLETRGNLSILTAPEGNARIVVADGVAGADAAVAVTAAWKAYRPDFARPIKLVTPRAPREGWEQRAVADYETSPNEKLVLQAIAYRKGQRWAVLLLDAAEATLEKRGAAVGLVANSLRAPGYAPETFTGRTPHKLDAARIEALKAFVKNGMDALGVPGAGLALIQDGRVVYEGGLGVKALGKPDPVDAHSKFMVASNTKGMSTLMLATLVDEGKLGWDDPVTKRYAAFRLGDDATTAQTKIRHLVCACTGLPRKDMEWIFNTPRDKKPATVFDLLAQTKPTSGFGEVFQYNNLITTAGGFIGGLIAHPGMEPGAAYDRAMQERVFRPLGMSETTFSFAEALAGNHAKPHGKDPDGNPAVSAHDLAYSIAPYRPAGGAWSTVHDMAKYAQLELAKGALPGGKRLVSEPNLLERRQPGVATGDKQAYGMGLFEDRTWGVPIVYHGGSMPGYQTNFWVIPDAGVAAVLLTNADDGNALLRPFLRRLVELVYDGKPEADAMVSAIATTIRANYAEERKRLTIPPAPDAVAALAGNYASPELGKLRVERAGDGVRFHFTDWSSSMASRKNDDGTVSFVVGSKDGKRTLIVRDAQHEYTFVES